MPGIIEAAGWSPLARQIMFYLICTPLRTSFVYIAYKYHHTLEFKLLALASSMFAMYLNAIKADDINVWWSRRFHLITSFTIVTLLIMAKVELVQYVLALDIAVGVVMSLLK